VKLLLLVARTESDKSETIKVIEDDKDDLAAFRERNDKLFIYYCIITIL